MSVEQEVAKLAKQLDKIVSEENSVSVVVEICHSPCNHYNAAILNIPYFVGI